LGPYVGEIAIAVPLANFQRMPPSPLACPVGGEGAFSRRAELNGDEVHNARWHIAGVFQESPEKSHRAELYGESETHVGAATGQYKCQIGIIEMKISGKLFG
jgi:hypothetical protein